MKDKTNKYLLIGAGVVVVGYLLYTKNQNKKSTNQVLLGVPKDAFERGGLAMPLIELDWQILSKLPNEFIVKSNGYNTRYYKNILQTKTGFSGFTAPDVYKHSFRTDGSDGGVQPIKISVREFLDAYNEFKKPISSNFDERNILFY